MSRFVLKPCRVLQTHLSPTKAEPESLTFEEVFAKFVPAGDSRQALNLRFLKPGAFIGLVKSSSQPNKIVNFILHNLDNSGNIDFVLKSDPSFESRLICAYRVDEAQFDSKITESVTEQVI